MVTAHETVADRFEAAGLEADRFVSVKDGQKMCIDHDTRYSDPTSVPGRNYGIYADEEDQVFVLDVDDHENASLAKESTIAVAALSGLPSTLEIESPHVETEGAGGHRIYKLQGEKTPAELFKDRFGAKNPVPSWGEVIAKNKYVVGAGSELDSCDKDHHDCSEEGEGHYEISHDDEIAEVEPEELISALATDPDLEDAESESDGSDSNSSSGETNTDSTQSGGSRTVTREYDREEIEEMLSHLPGDQHFDDWIRTGYAVYDWNDSGEGKEVFEEWSKTNRKWEQEESQRQINYIWENGKQAGDDDDDQNASVGTLVYLAKENGYEPNPNHDGGQAELDAITPENPAGQLAEENGCYGYWDEITSNGETKTVWKQVANFTLETLEFVETDDSEIMHLRVHPSHPSEEAYDVSVTPTAFNDFSSFKEEIVIGRTTQFSAEHGNETLNDLRMTVGAQGAPERKGVSHVGAATAEMNEWVTPDGVLTADGWDGDPEHRYYTKASSDADDESIVGEKWQLTPDMGCEYDTGDVQKALRYLPQARLPGRALAALGWFYAAPAKPLVHDEEGEFNHLHVRGKTESGKTSFLQLLSQAFGMDDSPWIASSTKFSLEQFHVGSRGAPVWLDEYKPSDMDSDKIDRLHRLLRIATREGVWTKGRPDQTHMKFRLQSPVVLSGEQQVAEPAVRRRMLQVNLTERATNDTEHVKAYSELAGEPYEDEGGVDRLPSGVDLQEHAKAYYSFLLSEDAEVLRDVWTAAGKTSVRLLNDLGMTLQDSESQAAQTVVFGYNIYKKLAGEVGVSDSELPDEDDLREAIRHLSENVGANGQRREHGDEFLELLSGAVNAGYVSGPAEAVDEDGAAGYRVYNPTATPEEAIAIHLPTAYPAVKKYAREYNIESDYNLLSKSDYDDEFGDLAESDGTHIASASHPVKINDSTKRCLLLDPYQTNERLGADFDLSPFGLVNVTDIEEDDSAGESDSDGGETEDTAYNATAIADAAKTLTGYITVTAEVVTAEVVGESEDAPVQAALKDESGIIDMVAFDSGTKATLQNYIGETVAIEGAKVEEYEGDRQLQAKNRVTEIHEIQPGVGYTEGDAPDAEDQQQLAATAADGGEQDKSAPPADATNTRASAERAHQVLQNNAPCSRTELVACLCEQHGLEIDDAQAAIEYAKTQTNPALIIGSDDELRPNGGGA